MSRVIDIFFAILSLSFSLPVLVLAMLLLLLIDGPPVVFRQHRVGLRGQLFWIYKLRTMKASAHQKEAEEGELVDMGQRGQARITVFGRFLRASKIDELPQLWNVLRGDLAMVGPRAHIPVHVHALNDKYRQDWVQVHSIKPGLTDPASIRYINEENELLQHEDVQSYYWEHVLPHKLSMYKDYIAHKSVKGDIVILVRTAWAIVCHWSARPAAHK